MISIQAQLSEHFCESMAEAAEVSVEQQQQIQGLKLLLHQMKTLFIAVAENLLTSFFVHELVYRHPYQTCCLLHFVRQVHIFNGSHTLMPHENSQALFYMQKTFIFQLFNYFLIGLHGYRIMINCTETNYFSRMDLFMPVFSNNSILIS